MYEYNSVQRQLRLIKLRRMPLMVLQDLKEEIQEYMKDVDEVIDEKKNIMVVT